MKNIFKAIALFFTCWIFAATASAQQLPSAAPSPTVRIPVSAPEVKVATPPTASAQPAPVIKNNNKIVVKNTAANAVESQGKEVVIKLASDTLPALPQVSLQTSPAKKSD